MPLPGTPQPSPAISPASANVGPAVAPQGNAGNTQAAMTKIKNSIQMLQSALPDIPMGNPLHEWVLNTVKNGAKHMTESGENKGLELQQLIQQAKNSAQSAPMAAMARMFPQGGGASTPPAMPSAQPPAAA